MPSSRRNCRKERGNERAWAGVCVQIVYWVGLSVIKCVFESRRMIREDFVERGARTSRTRGDFSSTGGRYSLGEPALRGLLFGGKH